MMKKLAEMGYINKVQSSEDKRIFNLSVTDKYLASRKPGEEQFKILMEKIRNKFNDDELHDIMYYLKEIETIL
jgi:DNA-binding MarR family transcriptional regulator